ncbi:MAG: Fic family protein [Candidatus Gracilibacteria bacterium]|nr:Fic family protein [Candidatus Gracilibacteria bacterium]
MIKFDKNKPYNDLPLLPGIFEYDQKEFLKLAIKASEEVGKLNGLIKLIPNFEILISPFLIKESVKSNEIENINTTTIKVLQQDAINTKNVSGPEKEVLSYRDSMLAGYKLLREQKGIGYNLLMLLQSNIEPSKPGVRKISGTVISNSLGEVLYTPPSGEENINRLLTNLEKFINNFEDDIDAFIKMPIIHYQFEAIHPFLDGNGRTGRILNILHLVLAGKLDYPILFLSEYINRTKTDYYRLLNKTTETGDYTDFTIYLLKGIILQAKNTSNRIIQIKELIINVENKMSSLNIDYHKITTILFSKPYQTLSSFEKEMGVSRATANRYIDKLEKKGVISSVKIGKNKLIYISEFIDLIS